MSSKARKSRNLNLTFNPARGARLQIDGGGGWLFLHHCFNYMAMENDILDYIVCADTHVCKYDELNLVGGCKSKGGRTETLEKYANHLNKNGLLPKITEKKKNKK